MKLGSEAGAIFPNESLSKRIIDSLLQAARAARQRPGVEQLAMVLCVALGIWLRWRGALDGSIPLWVDEELWAYRLIHDPLTSLAIRPIGFMLVTRWLVGWFGPTEAALRLLPWLAGIGVTLLAVYLAKLTLKSAAARVFLVAVFALHPTAIDFCKEFKAYSGSLCVHVACLIATIRYFRSGRSRWLWAAVAGSFLGVLFAQDTVFLLPSLYLVVLARALRPQKFPHLAVAVGGAAATLLLIGVLYTLSWRQEGAGGESESVLFWARHYDVFFISGSGSRLAWIGHKLLSLAAWPGIRRDDWDQFAAGVAPWLAPLKHFDRGLWRWLAALGIASLGTQRRWTELACLLAPPGLTLLFNQLGFWPFGVFRTNLFLLAYFIPLAAHALDIPALVTTRLVTFKRFVPRTEFASAAWSLAPAGLLVVSPFLFLQHNWHTEKSSAFTGSSHFVEAMHTMITSDAASPVPARAPLILDQYNCYGYRYHLGMNPRNRALAQEVEHRYHVQCASERRVWRQIERAVLDEHSRAWVLTKAWQDLAPLIEQQRGKLHVEKRFEFDKGDRVLFELLPDAPR